MFLFRLLRIECRLLARGLASSLFFFFTATVAFAGCAPTLSHIDPATTTSRVSWLETCVGAGRIQLFQNGTAPNFQDGRLFGLDNNLTAAQNAGVVTTDVTLTPATTYGGLRLCAVYFQSPKPLIYCTDPFAFKTLPVTTPVNLEITSPSSTPTSVSFSWTRPSEFTSYHVRLDDGNEQTVDANASSFTYAVPPLSPSTRYEVSVEGCIYRGITGNSCSNKWVTASITTQAAPPPVPVTTKQYTFNAFGAGDCTMVDATFTFRSDGTFQYTSRVGTRHSSTSDYWHVSVLLLDGGSKGIGSIPEFTGPAMKDAHPGYYYDWSISGTYDGSVYRAISGARMNGRC